jgi:NCS1 family nucleobase:cation symporter-1
VGVRASFWWTYVGAFVGGAWTMLVGTVAAALCPGIELVPALRTGADLLLPGSGPLLLLASLLGLVTITTLNFYGASLTLLSVADSLHPIRATPMKRVAALLVALFASVALALSASRDFAHEFGEFLSLLLYLFTPWTAINLVDFYYVRRGHYSVREIFNPHGMYGRWNWRGLLAYGVGFVSMVPFFSTGIYEGPVARALGGADIAMLIGLPVSTVVYLLACRSLDVEAERRAAAVADAGLDPAS